MHLSTILVPLFRWAPYGISRPVGFAATTATASDGGGGGRRKGREERRKGESGTQEAPETGCGQLFTSWRMIPRGAAVPNALVKRVDLRSRPVAARLCARGREKTNIELFALSCYCCSCCSRSNKVSPFVAPRANKKNTRFA